MARVSINKELYKIKDLKKLIKMKMVQYDYKQKDLARVLDISQAALSKKLIEGNYTLKDFAVICATLNFTDEEIIKAIR